DRFDEVWDGVYYLMPDPDIEHQDVGTGLAAILRVTIDWAGLGKVYQGVNVTDREDDWTKNYRCPDVAVYLPGNPARPLDTHWLGGPDFAIEIISPNDQARDKLPFYAAVGVRELLVIDRYPWSLELLRCEGQNWSTVGRSAPDRPESLVSAVLPLSFRL